MNVIYVKCSEHWCMNHAVLWTGVIPFHGFSMYGQYVFHSLSFSHYSWKTKTGNIRVVCVFCPTVAPLCFLYNEPPKLYNVFKEMYIRYFFRLHSISSSPSVSYLGFLLSWDNSLCTLLHGFKSCTCAPAGYRVFVPAVWAAAPNIPAAALLPPSTDWSAAVSKRCFILLWV